METKVTRAVAELMIYVQSGSKAFSARDARGAAAAYILAHCQDGEWHYSDVDLDSYDTYTVRFERYYPQEKAERDTVAAQDEAARLQAGRDELNRQESARAAGPDWGTA